MRKSLRWGAGLLLALVIATGQTPDAANIKYIAPNGGVQRSQAAKNTDIISVTDYGAISDGTTDNSAAFTAAITVAQAQNKTLTFPASANPYAYKTPIVITGVIKIAGPARLKYTGTSTTNAFTIQSTSLGYEANGVVVRDLYVDGNSLATNGAVFSGVFNSEITNLRVTNVSGTAILCQQCQLVTFNNPLVSGAIESFTTIPAVGLKFDLRASTGGISSACTVNNMIIERLTGGVGFWIANGQEITVNNGTSESNDIGIFADGTHGANQFNVVDVESNSTLDWKIGSSQNQFHNSYNPAYAEVLSTAHYNNFVGGAYFSLIIDSGATLNNFHGTGIDNFTDNGLNTQLVSAWTLFAGNVPRTNRLVGGLNLNGVLQAALPIPSGEVKMAGFGSNTAADLLQFSYDVSTAETRVKGSTFGSTVLMSQSNRNVVLRPDGTGVTLVQSPSSNTIFAVRNTATQTAVPPLQVQDSTNARRVSLYADNAGYTQVQVTDAAITNSGYLGWSPGTRNAIESGSTTNTPYNLVANNHIGITIRDQGKVGFKLTPIFANNAAALAGGLVAGELYRNGADPDQLFIVH